MSGFVGFRQLQLNSKEMPSCELRERERELTEKIEELRKALQENPRIFQVKLIPVYEEKPAEVVLRIPLKKNPLYVQKPAEVVLHIPVKRVPILEEKPAEIIFRIPIALIKCNGSPPVTPDQCPPAPQKKTQTFR